MAEKNANRRARNWCAIVYPDSAPEDWKDFLNDLNVKWACSPLHDKDIDDDSEPDETKKAHWHIVLCYAGNKSYQQVCEDLEYLNCPHPQICRDVQTSVRYFIHKDHPHKYQYSVDDIECYGGFDIGEAFALSKTEKRQILFEVMTYIREANITEYYDLLNYAMDCKYDTWYPVITESYTILLTNYIKSKRHGCKSDLPEVPPNVDPETGEIIE